ncbi:hypothetical protein [Sinobaca sp. H24]|uniref:hypothetical protein n=1 Tax=Sinobaca sp. H24 TaxID=2923376 RepID=UPI00207AF93F|nr:hypothetical protein [Sinobaca sp. H24]
MREYLFKDSIFLSNLTTITVENSEGKQIGSIQQEDRRGYKDKEGFTYCNAEGRSYYLGKKPSRLPILPRRMDSQEKNVHII